MQHENCFIVEYLSTGFYGELETSHYFLILRRMQPLLLFWLLMTILYSRRQWTTITRSIFAVVNRNISKV